MQVAGTRKWRRTSTLAKNQLHIIDIRETVRGLLRARKYISQVVEAGSLVLFVGTKRQAGGVIQREALRAGMPFVNERWLGGTLTNFRTIRSRMSRLEELEELRGSEELQSYSKKMQSSLNREYRKMYRNLNGLRSMNRLPECVVVIDPKKEKNSVREARKIGIASIALIDTDCDPDDVDLPIPGNDDGIRSIEMVIGYLADAVMGAKGITDAIAEVVPFQLLTPPAIDVPAAASLVTEDAPAEEESRCRGRSGRRRSRCRGTCCRGCSGRRRSRRRGTCCRGRSGRRRSPLPRNLLPRMLRQKKKPLPRNLLPRRLRQKKKPLPRNLLPRRLRQKKKPLPRNLLPRRLRQKKKPLPRNLLPRMLRQKKKPLAEEPAAEETPAEEDKE